MPKVLRCRDVGPDCDFVARGASKEEVFKRAAEHFERDHGLSELSPQMSERLREAIRDEDSQILYG